MRFLSLLLALVALPASAQITPGQSGSFAVGGQLGDFSGLALKFDAGLPIQVAAGWDLDGRDHFAAEAHGLIQQTTLNRSELGLLYSYYGPGAFLLLREGDDRFGDDDDVGVGGSIVLGAGLSFSGPFDVYLQAVPRLLVVPRTDFDVGLALGIRYYL
jgi:hypothetical protein